MSKKTNAKGKGGPNPPNNNPAQAVIEAAAKAGDLKLAAKMAEQANKGARKEARRDRRSKERINKQNNRAKNEAQIQQTHRTVARSTAAASAVNSATRYAQNMAGGYILPGTDLTKTSGEDDKAKDGQGKDNSSSNLVYPTNVR